MMYIVGMDIRKITGKLKMERKKKRRRRDRDKCIASLIKPVTTKHEIKLIKKARTQTEEVSDKA